MEEAGTSSERKGPCLPKAVLLSVTVAGEGPHTPLKGEGEGGASGLLSTG